MPQKNHGYIKTTDLQPKEKFNINRENSYFIKPDQELCNLLKTRKHTLECPICSLVIKEASKHMLKNTMASHLLGFHSEHLEQEINVIFKESNKKTVHAECKIKNCDYVTQVGYYTVDDAMETLRIHMRSHHNKNLVISLAKENLPKYLLIRQSGPHNKIHKPTLTRRQLEKKYHFACPVCCAIIATDSFDYFKPRFVNHYKSHGITNDKTISELIALHKVKRIK